jgi:hypothetical protein
MQVAIEHKRAARRAVADVHEQNLRYDLMSLDSWGGEPRLTEVKGLGGPTGVIGLAPNEKRVAEDRRGCYWPYVATRCDTAPRLQAIRGPAVLPGHKVKMVDHYRLSMDTARESLRVREELTQ